MKTENLPALLEVPDTPPDYTFDKYRAQLWAREMWWKGCMSISEIELTAGIPHSTMLTWLYGKDRKGGGWKQEKEKAYEKALRTEVENLKDNISYTLKKMHRLIDNSVDKLLDENVTLTVDQFNTVTSAFERLFKTQQLLLGKPSEIFQNDRITTWESVYEKLKRHDPVVYGEVKEITDAIEVTVERTRTPSS